MSNTLQQSCIFSLSQHLDCSYSIKFNTFHLTDFSCDMDLPTPANQSEQIVDYDLDVGEITSSPLQSYLMIHLHLWSQRIREEELFLWLKGINLPINHYQSQLVSTFTCIVTLNPFSYTSNSYPTASLITS